LTDPSIPPVGRTCGRARTGHQTRCPRRPRHCGRGRGRRVSRRQGWVDAGRGVTPRSEEPTAVTAGSTGIGGVASTPDGTVPLSPASVDRPDGPVFGDVRLPAPAGPRARDCHRVRRRVRAGLRPRASRPAGGDRAVRPRQYPRRSRRVSGTLLRRHGTGPVPAGPARRVGAALREPNHGRRGISSVHHCCVTLFNPGPDADADAGTGPRVQRWLPRLRASPRPGRTTLGAHLPVLAVGRGRPPGARRGDSVLARRWKR
jgi:hypothetical protein